MHRLICVKKFEVWVTDLKWWMMALQPTISLQNNVSQESIEKAFQKMTLDKRCSLDDYRFELLRADRYQEAYKHLTEHLCPDEPSFKSAGVVWDDQLEQLFAHCFQDGLSIALVSLQTDEIVGLRIMHIGKKNEPVGWEKYRAEPLRKALRFFQYKDDYFDIYSHYKVDETFSFFGLSVHREHRRKGLGCKLVQAALVFIENLMTGPVVVLGDSSSNFSRRIFEKLDFENFGEIMYDDYKVKGEVVLTNTGEHKSLRIYGKIV